MSTSTPTSSPVLSFLMPTRVTGWVRALAWASMLANALLIVTGGAVRLTGSGLGCPTWPRCTDESWTNTPEMGIHGVIEFGNRLLTFLLIIIALLTFLAVVRLYARHPLFWKLALAIGIGIILQAVIGGITVRTGLNPWVVGIHFVVSATLIAIASVLVNRVRRVSIERVAVAERAGQFTGPSRRGVRMLGVVLGVAGFLAIYLGTLVTGTGPHSGDAGEVVRHTFDPYIITRVHVVPVYVLVAASALGVAAAFWLRWPAALRRIFVVLAVLVAAQAVIGYYQFFNGVPILAVGLHMAGAAALAAVITMTVEKLYALSADPGQGPSSTASTSRTTASASSGPNMTGSL